MNNIINFSNYSQSKTGSISMSEARFTRPITVQIKSDTFIDEAPAKIKNAPDPLKNIEDIDRVIRFLIDRGRYRDNLIFVMGINFGLRCGDLLRMRVGHILNSDSSFRSDVRIKEEKTNKVRTCYMNDAIMDAAELYLCSLGDEINLNDFLFKSLSNNNSEAYYETIGEMETSTGKPINVKRGKDSPITVVSVGRILKEVINEELGIDVHAGTHLLRKTFAYHVIMNAPDRSRAVEFLQKIFGHASQSITLSYIGITDDEIRNTCRNLNLGANNFNFCYAAGLSDVI